MWKKFIGWLRSVFGKRQGGEEMDERTQRMASDEWAGLKKILSEHDKLLKDIEKAQDMIDGEFEILKRQPKRPDDPNHKIVMNYSKLIVGMKANYMMAKPVSHEVLETEELKDKAALVDEFTEEYKDILEDNDDHSVDFLTIRRGLIAGAAVVLFYFDEMGDIRYRSYKLNECIPIIDAFGEIKQVIHRYTDDEDKECIEIWDSRAVTYLVKDGDSFVMDNRKEINPAIHFLPIVPAAIFINGEFAKPKKSAIAYGPSELSKDVQSLLEKLSELISDNQNRLDIFCDPYLVFKNANVNKDEVLKMRQARAINIRGSNENNADVSYLLPELQNEPIEWQAMKLIDTIFETTNTPKIFKQEAQGALSSVAIRQLYTPLDNAVNEVEIFLNQYIRRKIMIITLMMNVKKILANGGDPTQAFERVGENSDLYNWRWIKFKANRNLPQNDQELVETIMMQKGTVSDHTLLHLLPHVEDAHEEMERVRQEKLDEPRANLGDIDGYIANHDKKIANRSMDDSKE